MADKVRVDVERVRALKAELAAINQLELDQIEFYENGQPMKVDPESLEWWKFTGLNNTDFIISVDPATGKIPITEIDDDEEEPS